MARSASPPPKTPSRALPRGPHDLTREEVGESQRTRLLDACTELLGEGGYPAVTIGELARRAGVSRAAFYEHFADKETCLLAAYDRFAASLVAAMTSEVDDESSWGAFVDATLRGYLDVLEADPVAARAFIVELDGAGPAARQRRRQAIHAFANLLAERHAEMRRRDSSLGPLPKEAYLALAFGIREVIRDTLDGGRPAALKRLAPRLRVLATAVVEGAAGAQAR